MRTVVCRVHLRVLRKAICKERRQRREARSGSSGGSGGSAAATSGRARLQRPRRTLQQVQPALGGSVHLHHAEHRKTKRWQKQASPLLLSSQQLRIVHHIGTLAQTMLAGLVAGLKLGLKWQHSAACRQRQQARAGDGLTAAVHVLRRNYIYANSPKPNALQAVLRHNHPPQTS